MVNVNAIEKLKGYLKGRQEALKTELMLAIKEKLSDKRFHERVGVEVIRVFNRLQGEFYGDNSYIESQDPAVLYSSNYADDILNEVAKNLTVSAESFLGGKALTLTILSDEFLGIGEELGPTDPAPPIKWAKYFLISGFKTNLIWISKENYAKLHPSGGTETLGRFGAGHIWRLYPREKTSFAKRLKRAGIKESLSQLTHPQSGKAGVGLEVFDEVFARINLETEIIRPAVTSAVSKVNWKYK